MQLMYASQQTAATFCVICSRSRSSTLLASPALEVLDHDVGFGYQARLIELPAWHCKHMSGLAPFAWVIQMPADA